MKNDRREAPLLRTLVQEERITSEVDALIGVVRPILEGTLSSLSHDTLADAGGRDNIMLRQLARVYRQGDGDTGICFEYAIHDAILRGLPNVLDRISTSLQKCKITRGDPTSILFGVEKGALQLIKTAEEQLTDGSRLRAGVQGRPTTIKLKPHLRSVAAAFRSLTHRKKLPWSISGLWKADLFVGRPESDLWVGASVKINDKQLVAAPGLRVGIVPAREGNSDAVTIDESRNLILCPMPYDGDFVQIFYEGWQIVRQFLAADAKLPKEVQVPKPADRQVCRFLEERRDFPVVEVIAALAPLAQPHLLKDEVESGAIRYEQGTMSKTGSVIAPIAALTDELY